MLTTAHVQNDVLLLMSDCLRNTQNRKDNTLSFNVPSQLPNIPQPTVQSTAVSIICQLFSVAFLIYEFPNSTFKYTVISRMKWILKEHHCQQQLIEIPKVSNNYSRLHLKSEGHKIKVSLAKGMFHTWKELCPLS